MPDQTYAVTEIVGTSPDDLDQAIRNAIQRASQTLHNLDWFEVTTVRGLIDEANVRQFQVTLKVGFRLDEQLHP